MTVGESYRLIAGDRSQLGDLARWCACNLPELWVTVCGNSPVGRGKLEDVVTLLLVTSDYRPHGEVGASLSSPIRTKYTDPVTERRNWARNVVRRGQADWTENFKQWARHHYEMRVEVADIDEAFRAEPGAVFDPSGAPKGPVIQTPPTTPTLEVDPDRDREAFETLDNIPTISQREQREKVLEGLGIKIGERWMEQTEILQALWAGNWLEALVDETMLTDEELKGVDLNDTEKLQIKAQIMVTMAKRWEVLKPAIAEQMRLENDVPVAGQIPEESLW